MPVLQARKSQDNPNKSLYLDNHKTFLTESPNFFFFFFIHKKISRIIKNPRFVDRTLESRAFKRYRIRRQLPSLFLSTKLASRLLAIDHVAGDEIVAMFSCQLHPFISIRMLLFWLRRTIVFLLLLG